MLTTQPTADASATHSDNDGIVTVDFYYNLQGILGLFTDTTHDSVAGHVTYEGATTGGFVMSDITPSSFSTWESVEIDIEFGDPADISVNILSCTGGYIGPFNRPLTNGTVDISDVNESCIIPIIEMQSGAVMPTISEVRVTWDPLAFFNVNMLMPSSVNACEPFTVDLQYALSYVQDSDIVIRSTLPEPVAGSYNTGYGQNLDLIFDTALNGGVYYTGGTSFVTTNGDTITVPPRSVVWTFNTLSPGSTGVLKYQVIVPCGAEDGLMYEGNINVESNTAAPTQSTTVNTTVSSSPSPIFSKEVTNVIKEGTTNYLFEPYASVATYTITLQNGINGSASEDIFFPTFVDDLSDIQTTMAANCSGAAFSSRITPYSSGVFNASGATITWDQSVLQDIVAVGETISVSYDVDYSNCAVDLLEFDNLVTLSGDNVSNLTDTETVTMLTQVNPTGIFAKTIGDLTSLLQEYAYEQPFSYYLQAYNIGTLRLEDIVMIDKLPDDIVLNAPINLPGTVTGNVFYYSGGAGLAPTSPPAYDQTSAMTGSFGTGWSTTFSPSARWIAVYVECLPSELFPGTSSYCDATSAGVAIPVNVRMLEPTGQSCADTHRDNIANFTFHRASNSITNTDGDIVDIVSPVFVQYPASRGIFHPIRPQISVSNPLAGPSFITPDQSGTYTLTVTNVGQDASTSTIVDVTIPQIIKNGVTAYPTVQVTNAGGGSVSYSLPTSFTVDLGALGVGQSRQIQFVLDQFEGVQDDAVFTVTASVEAFDDECGSTVANSQKSTTVNGTPVLSAFKTRNLSSIGAGDEIEYTFFALNSGNVVSTNTFIVDKIPDNTIFVDAVTSGYATNGSAYNCDGCQVYFAPQLPSLPSDVTVLDPFTTTEILSSFILGSQTSPGVWVPTMSNPYFIAVDMDNAANVFPTSDIRTFGFTVQESGNIAGDVIRNYGGILSEENLQSITNQVETTLLDNPGLVVDIESSSDILEACETYERTVDYYSDVAGTNTDTYMTVRFPAGIIPTLVEHQWNAQAISGGATPTGRYVVATGVALSGHGNLNGTYDVDININTLRGTDITGLEGGTFYFAVSIPCGTPSNSTFSATVRGYYSNSVSQGAVRDIDPVFVQNADLEIIKNVSRLDPLPGETITYTLDLANIGPHDATNIQIEDLMQVGLCYATGTVDMINPTWTIGEPLTSPGPCDPGTGQLLTWSMSGGNTIVGPQGTGYLVGFSDHLYITYDVIVHGTIPSGTDLLNGVVVSTTNPEDNLLNNVDDEQVTTPFPDPTVNISAPLTVLPGNNFAYSIIYSNNNRACANNSYVLHQMPDVYPTSGDGQSDIYVSNIILSTGTAYINTGLITSGVIPTFDPTDPLTGGWIAWSSTGFYNPINHVAILNPYLCDTDGPLTVQIVAQAIDPVSSSNLPVGLVKPYSVEIFTTDVEDDYTNNYDATTITIPGLDLAVEIEGLPQGTNPGNVPGGDQNYLVTYSNVGVQPSCDNYVEVTFSSGFVPGNPLTNIVNVTLTDVLGNSVSPVDSGGNIITDNSLLLVPVTMIGSNSYRFQIGTNPSNVCLPVGSEGQFYVYGDVYSAALEGDVIDATAVVGEDSPGIELVLSNNTDTTSVTIHRAELFVTKSGTSYAPGATTGSSTMTNSGDTITYHIEYDNIGNAVAENAVIEEVIPPGSCYIVGSLEANQPLNSVITYYDTGNNVIATPFADSFGQDCTVARIELYFATLEPFATFFQQNTYDEWEHFSSGTTILNAGGTGSNGYLEMTTFERYEEQFATGGRHEAGNGQMVDADADPDFDYWFYGSNSSGYLYELSGSTWVLAQELSSFGDVRVVASQAVDTDGDGKVEHLHLNNRDYVYSGGLFADTGGKGYFTGLGNSDSIGLPGFGDITGDGIPDIALGRQFGSVDRIYHLTGGAWVWNVGSGSLSAINSRAAGFLDMDGDGLTDAAWHVTNNNGHRFSVYSGGSWTTDPAFLGVSYLDWIAFGDLDGDNAIDHAVTFGIGTNRLWEYVGGVWVQQSQSFVGYGATHGTFEDFNNDGKDDALTVAAYSAGPGPAEQNSVYRYNDVTDTWTRDIALGQNPSTMAQTVDINQDGTIDGAFVMNGIQWNLNFDDFFYWYNIKHPDGDTLTTQVIDPAVLYSGYGSLLAWDDLELDIDVPAGATLNINVLDEFDTPILTGLAGTTIDLSSIDVLTYPRLKLQAQFLRSDTDRTVGPELNSWRLNFLMDGYATPSFEFDVRVGTLNPGILLNLNDIFNIVTITSDTPENTLTNNQDDHSHVINKVDVEIQKQVDLSAVHSGDAMSYTLSYGNNGPQDATGVVITDVLPDLFVLSSSTPPYDTIAGNTISWDIGYLPAYATGEITVDGTAACNTTTEPAVDVSFPLGSVGGVYLFTTTEIGNDCVWLGGTSEYMRCYFSFTLASLPLCTDLGGGSYINPGGEPCVPTGTGNFALCSGGAPTFGHCITEPVPPVFPESSLVVDPFVNTTMSGFGFNVNAGVPISTYEMSSSLVVTGFVCPTLGDIMTNFTSISTTSTDSDPTNNQDSVQSVVGDYADVFTTVNCPPVGVVGQSLTCDVDYGNIGNLVATGGDVTIDLDINTDFVSILGNASGSCTYTDNRTFSGSYSVGGSHYLTCSGGNFTTVAPGFSEQLVLNLQIQNNPALAPNVVTNAGGVTLNYVSTITTLSPELFTANNTDDDDVIVQWGSLSTIAGNVYVDVLQDQVFSPFQDINLANVQVCLDGTTYYGASVGVGGSIPVPCTFTDVNGDYSFVGLLPGTYDVSYGNSTSYVPDFSDAGTIQSVQVGQGSIQGLLDVQSVDSIALGIGEDSVDNDFGLISSACTQVVGLQILNPANNSGHPSSTPITVNGIIADLSATVTLGGIPITNIAIDGSFSVDVVIVGSSETFYFAATNGMSVCDEQFVLTLNNNTGGPSGGGTGGGGGGGPQPDPCGCQDVSGSLYDGLCYIASTGSGSALSGYVYTGGNLLPLGTPLTQAEYEALYCPTTDSPPPPVEPPTDPTFPSAPIPTTMILLPPELPKTGPSGK